MRSFTDSDGSGWDADLQFGSYGLHVVIFGRRDGGELRKAALPAPTRLEAEQALAALDEAGLRELLAAAVALDQDLSQPWA